MDQPTESGRKRSAKGGATARDVAVLAGVSPMTVSRVVNGDARHRHGRDAGQD
ncbi:MAG: LacI family transcriptional regulator, partial [Brevundimonas sp.]